MFKKILVALDGSARAEQALPLATHLAQAAGCVLLLVRVVDIQYRIAWQAPDIAIDYDRLLAAERESAASYLAQVARSDELADLNVQVRTSEGRPDEAILDLAREQGVDLMIISSHGYTGLKKLALGSVARQIERHSPIPVLILRGATDSGKYIGKRNGRSVRVIVPLDGHRQAEQILPAATALSMALSAPERGAIHLVMIVPESNQQELASTGEYRRALQDARAYLTSVVQRLQQDEQIARHLVIASSVSQRASVSKALAAFVMHGTNQEGAGTYDVIAMATHGREGLDRLLHASITEQLLDATSVPILTIKSVPEHSPDRQ